MEFPSVGGLAKRLTVGLVLTVLFITAAQAEDAEAKTETADDEDQTENAGDASQSADT